MKCSVFIAVSLDGYIARPDGALDWLPGSDPEAVAEGPSDDHGFQSFFDTVDCLLMGRGTYDIVHGFPKWFYGQKPVYVLTHREMPPPPEGAIVEAVSGSAAEALALLESRGHEHVYVDGGKTIQQFLVAGLLSELTLNSIPILLGKGIPLFGDVPADIRMEHVETRTFVGGMVQTRYRVQK